MSIYIPDYTASHHKDRGLKQVYRHAPTCSVGRDSAVGIARRYGLDGPGIESRWRRDFPHPSIQALGSTQPPIQWVPGLSSWEKLPGRGVEHPPHLALRLKKLYSYTSVPTYGPCGLFYGENYLYLTLLQLVARCRRSGTS